MKTTKSLNITILALLGLALSSLGQDYIYQFSTTVGVQQYCDCWIQPPGQFFGIFGLGAGLENSGGPFSGTIDYNPSLNTVRLVGSYLISSSTDSFSTARIGSGVFTVGYNFGGDSTISFDTGILTLEGDPTGQTPVIGLGVWIGDYYFSGTIPYTANVTYNTGGQNYYGSYNGQIRWGFEPTFSQLTSTSVALNSVSLMGVGPGFGAYSGSCTIGAPEGTYYVGMDGFDGSWPGDCGIGDVTAMAVPEPGSLMIFSLGAIGLTTFFRRRPS